MVREGPSRTLCIGRKSTRSVSRSNPILPRGVPFGQCRSPSAAVPWGRKDATPSRPRDQFAARQGSVTGRTVASNDSRRRLSLRGACYDRGGVCGGKETA